MAHRWPLAALNWLGAHNPNHATQARPRLPYGLRVRKSGERRVDLLERLIVADVIGFSVHALIERLRTAPR